MSEMIERHLREFQGFAPEAAAARRMDKACHSLAATLAVAAAGSLFDTEPAAFECALDALAGDERPSS